MMSSTTFNMYQIIPPFNIEEQLKICEELSIPEEVFHSLQLQLRGICVDTKDRPLDVDSAGMFNEIHLRLPVNETSGQFSVPKKIPIMPKGTSPYEYIKDRICCNGTSIFEKAVIEVPLPEMNKPRYLKGYSFPFLGTAYPYYELRINPKNTGACPGKCLFCHRGYSHRLRPSQSERLLSPEEVVNTIVHDHGAEAFKHVSHVAVITELFGREDSFLRYIETLKELLAKAGCDSRMKFGACAQDVRSEAGLRKLYEIVDDRRYSFTLEAFSNRPKIMGKYKAIPLEIVEQVLERARTVGFEEIKINYISGIDAFSSLEKGFRRLQGLGLIDTIGLSVLTAFFPDQLMLRSKEAWEIKYYYDVIRLIKELNISFYKPNCFEMGYPLQFL